MNSGNKNQLEKQIKIILDNKKIPYLEINKYILKIGSYIFNFINQKNEQNENEHSLIIYTNLNQKNILLMGDALKEAEMDQICEYNLPDMDILKVGHHGSRNSSDELFLQLI